MQALASGLSGHGRGAGERASHGGIGAAAEPREHVMGLAHHLHGVSCVCVGRGRGEARFLLVGAVCCTITRLDLDQLPCGSMHMGVSRSRR